MLASLLLAATLSSAARLPADVVPTHYDLFFDVDVKAARYSGAVDIDVDVRGPVKEVVLNAVDLDLSDVSVTQGGETVHPVAQPRPKAEQVALPVALAPGAAHVHLKFAAPLRKDLRGFYLAKTPSGELWAATDFEPTNARRAFPCFDEPAMKATFKIVARIPTELSAVSNGKLLDEHLEIAGGHRLAFEQTKPLPTYLVALAVGHFGVAEGKAEGLSGPIPIRVITQAGQEALGTYAVHAAEKILPWYEAFTGIPYPFGKLDMVAVPEFAWGGMENAGVIFYRGTRVLLDEASASIEDQQNVERVLAHEIAHQWFGDLVTLRWWDDTWLNEAFASLMGYFCVRDLKPEWPLRQQFTADVAHAKGTDSLRATHAVHNPVADPEEAQVQFDEITYTKGEGVLAMLSNAVGDDRFRLGLHRYLAANAFGNARAEDLFDAIGEAAGSPVTEVALDWIDQAGLPVVSVRRKGDKLLVSQRRFTASPAKDDGTRWRIPFCVDSATPAVAPGTNGAQKRADECLTVTPTTREVDVSHLEVPTAKDYVFANAEGVGFYRTAYDAQTFAALLPALRAGALTAEERIALLADLKALAWSGGKLAPLLDASQALQADRDLLVLTQLTDALVELATLAGPAERTALAAWTRRRLGPIATELGWTAVPGETPDRSVLRAKILDTLDRVGRDPAVAAEAARRVDAAAKDNGALDPTLRATLLNIAARHGDQSLWNNFEAERAATNVPQLREDYLRALMAFQQPALVQRALAATLTDAVPAQDLGIALEVSMSADETRPAALRFLGENFAAVAARLNANARRTLIGSFGKACSAPDRDALAAMVKAHPIAGNERPIDRALETVEVCARARSRLNAELGTWLRAHP